MARTQGGEETRQRLLEAAISQLAAEGMRGLTHRKVEARAGVSQGSAKYHFGSTEGMVEAVVQHMVDVEAMSILRPSPEVVAQSQAAGFPTEELMAMANRVFEELLSRGDLLRARYVLFVHAADRPELQEIIRRGRDVFVAEIGDHLVTPDPELGARFVIALVDGMVLHQLSAPSARLAENAGGLMLLASAATMDLPEPGSVGS